MLKLLFRIYFIQTMMLAGCGPDQKNQQLVMNVKDIILNGRKIDLPADKKDEISKIVVELFTESDEFYELLVTDNLLESIKGNESWIEIVFEDAQTINSNKFGTHSIYRVLIPLSGKFASNGQVSFFSGEDDYSNTPLINSSGLNQINEVIDLCCIT